MEEGESRTGRRWSGTNRLVAACVWACVGVSLLPGQVSGHGYLIEPPSRSSAWRAGFETPRNYDDNGLNCGGFQRQWSQNGGKCGPCGDPWDSATPRPNEIGGKYGTGIIVRQYAVGQSVEMRLVITAQHKGWYEFRLCSRNESIDSPTTQECLDENLLTVGDSRNRTRYQLPANATTGMFLVTVNLPGGVTCTRCVLQWKWHAGNNWGVGTDGVGCIGCGPQEEFINCADISILKDLLTTSSVSQQLSTSKITDERKADLTSRSPRPRRITDRNQGSRRSGSTAEHDHGSTRSSSTAEHDHGSTRSSSTAEHDHGSTRSRSTTEHDHGSTRSSSTAEHDQSSTTPLPMVTTATTTTTLVSTSESENSVVVCEAIGLFKNDPKFNAWCASNCAQNYCPESHCQCYRNGTRVPLVPNSPDFTKCRSVGLRKGQSLDAWCISNCAAGFCPQDYCQCRD